MQNSTKINLGYQTFMGDLPLKHTCAIFRLFYEGHEWYFGYCVSKQTFPVVRCHICSCNMPFINQRVLVLEVYNSIYEVYGY